MEQNIVTLEQVCKVYKTGDSSITALSTTDMSFESGKLTLIMGPSGSGKTTLLSILGCIIYPTSGKVFYKGREVTGLNERDLADLRLHEVGFVFQQFNLLEPLNALENVMHPLILQGASSSVARSRARRALEKVGLADRIFSLPKKLSGGQKQRVAIARALVADPAMILCDEPTASLDAYSAEAIMVELNGLASVGKAVIVVTHDLRLRKFADKTIYVEEGVVSMKIKNEQYYK
ncbi:ABC transporter ATP-binding protein [Sphingobacterium faecale]|uniref:ABC transporter ATP-binding protein n=1 Tax=Sphingobacterium faecale TaxID=2803775 RepID=A0ABS1R578_9SPHI|nr:ABC transporter ATP-binding protein [Sphingobacterium faecale]MBL1409389.1 ABC transporter ATP-binding protein [Sphingobacterium faecale]